MVCDIHTLFQTYESGRWINIPSQYDNERCYPLFAWLADVRNYHEIAPIAPARGIPADMLDGDDPTYQQVTPDVLHQWEAHFWRISHDSDPDMCRRWLGDHSHSWLMSQEILSATMRPVVSRDLDAPDYPAITQQKVEAFLAEVKRLEDRYGWVRLVFGFDN